MARRRVAVLISGSGSNLQALIDRSVQPEASFEIVHVLSNIASAFGLERARLAGIATSVVDHRGFDSRQHFDRAVGLALQETGAELVCLAGFMRILGAELVEAWADRMLNIHPALLPSFKGLHTHERALAAGVRLHGCTVHVVRPALDDGPIVVQGVVPVLAADDPALLAKRVMEVEHRAYPLALDLLASGRAVVTGETVRVDPGFPSVIVHPSLA
ncbi:MAG TPA: phosphoribosylglycinamide formyltransferase [Geminicoccus sp.]|jgi:phosphoribosylglycinamide formyltransferase-1|uniref:phosphoribosylglycinamide formyltransferase n=1 Tax=Geminicoccus sp. TaxID=2024832 RepID=UPI002E345055|nr:phosphoribosylglycinamide formyltransferase [Geminicoccus sp.]HEX2525075.1 phosphoribosylglycinamide formyltransferase [Geminicoccus sp.]